MAVKDLVKVLPSERQLAWQQTEFYAFFHFGMNTMTNREWGTGDTDPQMFNPSNLDCEQWVEAIKAAGMKGAILTCKHHDGFCLWPSKMTDYSVKGSPWQSGTGDVVAELATACERNGIKFGIYLSPWDRHEKTYGTPAYNDYFCAQLQELLTNYGDIFEVWFDGANGSQDNKPMIYDWQRYYDLIRKYQPQAAIAVCGPDVRWIGNEAGHTRPNEWSVVPRSLTDNEKIAARSQKDDDRSFAKHFSSEDSDLGSRDKLAAANQPLIWYPAEVNTSIRPGWFYHEQEDQQVKSAAELQQLYNQAVGGNATLLLNIPPNAQGLLANQDVLVLKQLGAQLARPNLLATATVTFSSQSVTKQEVNLLDLQDKSCWQPTNEDLLMTIQVSWPQAQLFNQIALRENLHFSQRIEQFVLTTTVSGIKQTLYSGGTVGYQKICQFETIKTDNLQIQITKSRLAPTLKYLSINKF